uniref:Aminotransferase class I/classII large domain-containing protein n=1 Tax=Globisporangium ultimum (strain ATCC 200006 / CBS 805.95 / DAOM BR144) TaxID=431595 RepID=K3WJA5_GLOUD
MAHTLDAKLRRALERRRDVGTLRALQVGDPNCVDFFSNDYLGFAKSARLQALVAARKQQLDDAASWLGSTGSRLISGNSRYFMQVEEQLAAFYNSEAALLFNSGYTANLGVLSSLPQADDVVLYDELIHNSCHEGLRLSRAHAKGNTHAFRHNDVQDLAAKLQRLAAPNGTSSANRCIFVVVESLYSMDGDVAPLVEMTAVCEKAGAVIIVDEAHGTGVYGPQGSGIVRELGLDTKPNVIACRVYTFGKAMGCHGAVVCGSQVLIDYLVNYARSFIYTTAFPFEQLVTVQCAHEFCATVDTERQRVLDLVQYFKRSVRDNPQIPSTALLESDSPIQGVVFEGNHQVLHAAKEMLAMGIRVIPIRSPTVPKGSERFRIVIHADNTEREIDQLVAALDAMFRARETSSTATPDSKL